MPAVSIPSRQAEARARIVAAAGRRLADGIDAASLDEIAADADVARATLFNLFGHKDALLEAVLSPVLDDGLARLAAIAPGPPRARVAGLVDVYLALWATHRDALRVAYHAQSLRLGPLAHRHVAFVRAIVAVLDDAAGAGVLHARDAGPRPHRRAAARGPRRRRRGRPRLDPRRHVPADRRDRRRGGPRRRGVVISDT